jgi:hypothetical protein
LYELISISCLNPVVKAICKNRLIAIGIPVLKSKRYTREPVCMENTTETITIPKEDAVFWLDAEGRWHNEHGPFEHPKVSAYFHACIQHDADGYYVGQQRDAVYEKVYFRYADTALFVFGVQDQAGQLLLRLNTGRRVELDPAHLYVKDDHLYIKTDQGPARFNQKSLMQISNRIDDDGSGLYIQIGDKRVKISGEY